ncbi:MAG TPA: GNAT family N-acetyltransferase [Bacillota bacterium]|nr:GNAT family N-acetyltransferase [Bacillota bacterium]
MKITSGDSYVKEVKELIETYTVSIGRNLDFQNLDEELHDFPSKYSYPKGKLLAALSDEGEVIGCVAYTKKSDIRSEMKRLYVKPEYRNLKAGRALAEAIINEARKDGYKEMVLDTLAPMQSAIKLYKSLGFVEIPPYYDNPMEDVLYMKLEL